MAKTRTKKFTIYDRLEEVGMFDGNAANAQSDDYKGPQQYPKMLYHPEGATVITKPGEIITTPLGPKVVGEQREIITRTVGSEAEELEALEAGWHDHPSKAIAAAGGTAPEMSAGERLDRLEAEKRKLEAELAGLRATALANAKPSGAVIVSGK